MTPALREQSFDHFVERMPFMPAPCPRCGADDEIWPEAGPGPYGLYCRACQWGGPRASEADGDPDPAIAAWNDEARKVALARELGLRLNLVQPKEESLG